MKIIFGKHAKKDKFPMLAKHRFYLTEEDVIKVIKESEHEDKETDKPNIIASKSFDEKHILRVVYKKEDDIIKIITFYPAEKGRYY
ncbi:hypothetical protein A2982_02525 [candidate division WWE3 bacterium RIFCSPLOWO2_01_FULL_39_13]|uniref:DUF4258 domain-containing protein n=1 Tax=candidate division WWE3 bacterium RIFCSPLOWO2_01_FULL_39_13 TaxID=1802624 RepID=A0A1F4V4D3_UNCKA|nr:MAG: hypothetical protein A2982_02525 [candidate division WWE3 bacterium RIFCSPLOWO2_01_FULL_39_13]